MTAPHARALGLFAGGPRSTRLHTRLRWWWCPFPAIEAAVGDAGPVLEVGCGHGLLSLYLALARPGRRVTGVDIDAPKIEEAGAAARRLGPGEADITFEAVAPGYVPGPEGSWGAVVFADILYLLPVDDQRQLVGAAARAVHEGGVVVIKEMGLTPRWKMRWNRFQETLATKVFRITESVGAGLTFVAPDEMAAWLAAEGLDVTHHPVDKGYPWPHHLVVGTRPTPTP
jgi:2-polyprenyl-3-methyl-5-hydroxy-6-metoxy-1,4-benzoquinol methylase